MFYDFAKILNVFAGVLHEHSLKAGWWNDPVTGEDLRHNPYAIATKLALITCEVSEAIEAHRKGLMDDHLPHRTGVECEMADVVIRAFDFCGARGLDLGGAIMEKIEYNQKRQDHKIETRKNPGGKKF